MMRKRTMIVVAFVLVAVVAVWVSRAHARDLTGKYAGSPHADWFKSQHNAQGEWCCNEADGMYFDGNYTLNPDGSVTLQTENGPHNLPAYMVLKSPNPTGRAVWWRLGTRDYCFSPGTLG